MTLLQPGTIHKIDKTISIPDEIITKINEFVEQIDTKHYEKRGQTNEKKKKKDQRSGKMAEFATYLFLTEQNIKCSEPDMTIYEKKKKSFAPDMMVGETPLHCKSCHKDSKYPVSWIFQKSDLNGLSGKDKEFYNKENKGLLSCCVVDHKNNNVQILWLLDKNIAIDILEPPKVLQLMNVKECLYSERLEKDYGKKE